MKLLISVCKTLEDIVDILLDMSLIEIYSESFQIIFEPHIDTGRTRGSGRNTVVVVIVNSNGKTSRWNNNKIIRIRQVLQVIRIVQMKNHTTVYQQKGASTSQDLGGFWSSQLEEPPPIAHTISRQLLQ